MEIFTENTLSSFTNGLSEPLSLPGNWQIALSEIIMPAEVKNVTDTSFTAYVPIADTDRTDDFEMIEFNFEGGIYAGADDILSKLQELSGLDFEWEQNPIDHKLSLTFGRRQGLQFPTREIPDILGFKGISVSGRSGKLETHIGWKQLSHADDKQDKFTLTADYPVDITAGQHLIFVYVNIIEYQTVGDTKAALLRLLPLDIRLRNSKILQTELQKHSAFKDLQFKNLLSNTIQTIKVELVNESGNLLPFLGTGRTSLTLKFRKVS